MAAKLVVGTHYPRVGKGRLFLSETTVFPDIILNRFSATARNLPADSPVKTAQESHVNGFPLVLSR